MVTLLPALLVICGRWVFWPKRPTFGSDEPTSRGFWARVGKRIAPRPRRGLGRHGRPARPSPASACSGSTPSGLSTEDTYTKEFDSIKGQQVLADHGLADNSNTIQVVANTDALPQVQEALAGDRRPRRGPPGPGRGRTGAPTSRRPSTPTSPRRRRSPSWRRPATPCTQVDGADALVGGGAAFYLDTKVASNRDNKVIIPIVLVVVFLILVGLLRALAAPLHPDRHGVLSFGAALGHLGPAVRVRLRVRRFRSRRSRCSPSCSWSPWASTTTSS